VRRQPRHHTVWCTQQQHAGWRWLRCWHGRQQHHTVSRPPSTVHTQSINPTPAFSRGSFVPQPSLPARIFLLRLLTADDWAAEDWAAEAVQESIDG
jgi:hypothetical protein